MMNTYVSEAQRDYSVAIVERLLQLPYFACCQSLLAYYPLQSEPDILRLLKVALQQGKDVALPRIGANQQLIFHLLPSPAGLTQLQTGPFNLREPLSNWPTVELDDRRALIVVPGLYFTISGARLGRGGGYYDRFLERHTQEQLLKVGLCFENQLIDSLPQEEHDQGVDLVITERTCYWGTTLAARLAKLC